MYVLLGCDFVRPIANSRQENGHFVIIFLDGFILSAIGLRFDLQFILFDL